MIRITLYVRGLNPRKITMETYNVYKYDCDQGFMHLQGAKSNQAINMDLLDSYYASTITVDQKEYCKACLKEADHKNLVMCYLDKRLCEVKEFLDDPK